MRALASEIPHLRQMVQEKDNAIKSTQEEVDKTKTQLRSTEEEHEGVCALLQQVLESKHKAEVDTLNKRIEELESAARHMSSNYDAESTKSESNLRLLREEKVQLQKNFELQATELKSNTQSLEQLQTELAQIQGRLEETTLQNQLLNSIELPSEEQRLSFTNDLNEVCNKVVVEVGLLERIQKVLSSLARSLPVQSVRKGLGGYFATRDLPQNQSLSGPIRDNDIQPSNQTLMTPSSNKVLRWNSNEDNIAVRVIPGSHYVTPDEEARRRRAPQPVKSALKPKNKDLQHTPALARTRSGQRAASTPVLPLATYGPPKTDNSGRGRSAAAFHAHSHTKGSQESERSETSKSAKRTRSVDFGEGSRSLRTGSGLDRVIPDSQESQDKPKRQRSK